ncbi:hypothetical protein FHT80_002081 [Rhizobium sp. BK226]|nr:hypothetical protein [Rhizobium sp. BK226]
MFVSVCDRPLVAELMEAQDRAVMETKSATIHRKMPLPARQLPITESAHKAEIIGDASHAAVIAGIDVSTEPWCAAGFDRTHATSFVAAKMTDVITAIITTMPPKDVGDLKDGTQTLNAPLA